VCVCVCVCVEGEGGVRESGLRGLLACGFVGVKGEAGVGCWVEEDRKGVWWWRGCWPVTL